MVIQESGVGGITSGGDADHCLARCQAGCVHHSPTVVDDGLGHSVKVHGIAARRIDRDKSGRHFDGAKQRHHQVRVVAADPAPESRVSTAPSMGSLDPGE